MSREVNTVPSFDRATKKLTKTEKAELDKAVEAIAKDPTIGESKKGDLAWLSVYKFKIHAQMRLVGYMYEDNEVVLVAYGPHENFYRDVKRS